MRKSCEQRLITKEHIATLKLFYIGFILQCVSSDKTILYIVESRKYYCNTVSQSSLKCFTTSSSFITETLYLVSNIQLVKTLFTVTSKTNGKYI